MGETAYRDTPLFVFEHQKKTRKISPKTKVTLFRNSFFGTATAGIFSAVANAPKQPVRDSINVHFVKVNTPVSRVDLISHQGDPSKPKTSRGLVSMARTHPLCLPTPVSYSRLQSYLSGYDKDTSVYLVSGFQFGFSLGTVGTVPASCHPNHVSALKNCNYVDDKIKKELALGRIKGPYDSFPLSNFKCSPLGVVPKKEANCFRLIHDLSFGPEDSAVNHFIPPEHATVSLETFDDVALMVVQAGKGCLLSKGDIQDAFSIVPVSPLDYHKLGFSWQGKFYFSRVLPMGSSSSVRIFETFTKYIQWILQNKFCHKCKCKCYK